jgi:hypothetical protein
MIRYLAANTMKLSVRCSRAWQDGLTQLMNWRRMLPSIGPVVFLPRSGGLT